MDPQGKIRIHLDELLSLAFLLALVTAALVFPDNDAVQSLTRTRLAFFCIVGLFLFTTVYFVFGDHGSRETRRERLSTAARAFWPLPTGLVAYETLKHLHANRITMVLGIEPKDSLMLRIDELLFGAALPLKLQWMVHPWLTQVMKFAYVYIYYASPIVVLGLFFYFRADRNAFYEVRRAILFTLYGGYCMYILVPVAGPLFHVGDQFTVPLKTGDQFHNVVFDVMRYQWDCFPSLHTAVPWVTALVAGRHVVRPLRILLVVIACVVTLSTVYLRYHYGIDLIAGIAWACITAFVARRASGKGVTLDWNDAHTPRARMVALGALFIGTGAVGLVFEQILEKLISTVVGSSTPAAAVVLAVYFSGLAIGGALYSRLSASVTRPLAVYAGFEAFVGVWALFIYFFFDGIQAASVSLMQGGSSSTGTLFLVRALVSCVWILPPTIAMGASFPAVVAGLRGLSTVEPRKMMAWFYSLNLVGAIIGTVGGAYGLLPRMGLSGALLTCAVVELIVFLVALKLAGAAATNPVVQTAAAAPMMSLRSLVQGRARFVLLLGFVSGFVFFSFEVLSVHLIGAVVGTSAYAFADMLAAILVGMLLAGVVTSTMRRKHAVVPDSLLGIVFAVCGVAVALTTGMWDQVPNLFLFAGKHVTTFWQGELVRFLVACLILIPQALPLGLVYPLLFRLSDFDEDRREQLSGLMVAANAIGCFAGSIATAFFLLPTFGSRTSLLGIALALGVAAVAMTASKAERAKSKRSFVAVGVLVGVGVLVCVLQPKWNWNSLTMGANVYFSRGATKENSKIVFLHEDALGGITTVVENKGTKRSRGKPYTTLLTNGKFQGNDNWEMPAQISFALVPLTHMEHRDRALVIGLGTGHSAQVVVDSGFKNVDIAEISPGIIKAAREHLPRLNGGVLDRSNVTVHVDDGRNYLLRTEQRYDLISIELSSVWFAGVTNLYSREFYRAARQALNKNGILQQWMQFHHVDDKEIRSALLSLQKEFKNVELYYVGGQGVLVASKAPLQIRPAEIERLQSLPAMRPHLDVLREWGYGGVEQAGDWLVLAADEVRAVAKKHRKATLNTDMNRYLEYTTPRHYLEKGNLNKRNLEALMSALPPEVAAARLVKVLLEPVEH